MAALSLEFPDFRRPIVISSTAVFAHWGEIAEFHADELNEIFLENVAHMERDITIRIEREHPYFEPNVFIIYPDGRVEEHNIDSPTIRTYSRIFDFNFISEFTSDDLAVQFFDTRNIATCPTSCNSAIHYSYTATHTPTSTHCYVITYTNTYRCDRCNRITRQTTDQEFGPPHSFSNSGSPTVSISHHPNCGNLHIVPPCTRTTSTPQKCSGCDSTRTHTSMSHVYCPIWASLREYILGDD